ncbi:hypothetical protein ACWDSJ_27740 [Nocardia sp. NPDC003482]
MRLTYTAEWNDIDAHIAELAIGTYLAEVRRTATGYGWHVNDTDTDTTVADGDEDDETDARDAAERAIATHHADCSVESPAHGLVAILDWDRELLCQVTEQEMNGPFAEDHPISKYLLDFAHEWKALYAVTPQGMLRLGGYGSKGRAILEVSWSKTLKPVFS